MKKVAEVSNHADLSPLTSYLWKVGVKHRIIEQGDVQEIWVAESFAHPDIESQIEQWLLGSELPKATEPTSARTRAIPSRVQLLLKAPFSLGLIGLSVLVTLLVGFGDNTAYLAWFTISDFAIRGNELYYQSLSQTLASGQLWRLWSPALFHGSSLHLTFNLLWIFAYAVAIEHSLGKRVLIPLVLVSAAASNIVQFWVSGPLFGGMSGVVYAVLTFCWCWDVAASRRYFYLPNVLFALMIAWIVAGYVGILSALGLGNIANTAHLVGAVVGLLFACVLRLKHRRLLLR